MPLAGSLYSSLNIFTFFLCFVACSLLLFLWPPVFFAHLQVKECQVLLFSATVPSWVRNIANKYTANPLTVDAVGKNVSGRPPEGAVDAANDTFEARVLLGRYLRVTNVPSFCSRGR